MMENTIFIKHGPTSLSFRPSSFERIHLRYTTNGVDIESYPYLYTEDNHFMVSFFEDLSSHWKGWEGAKSWEPIDGGFRFDATHDSLAYVTLKVFIVKEDCNSDGWDFSGKIKLDLGSLKQLASDIKDLLKNEEYECFDKERGMT